MSIKKIDQREYTCNACGFTITVDAMDQPTATQATGKIDLIHGTARVSIEHWWLCGDCAKILNKFLCGDLRLDAESKQLALLDDRFDTWWTEYCRMESALKTLGHSLKPIKNGTSALVEYGFRKEDE